jgi:hypothetical protein
LLPRFPICGLLIAKRFPRECGRLPQKALLP